MTKSGHEGHGRAAQALYVAVPCAAAALVPILWAHTVTGLWLGALAVLLAVTVMVAVHHSEVIAARVGEPFGSLILAVSVTAIEVGMILVLMTSAGAKGEALARDTVFAALLISATGMIGLSLLVATIREGEVYFNSEGSVVATSTLAVLGTLTLVMPSLSGGAGAAGYFSPTQLAAVGVVALLVYGLFVFAQTLKHRQYFLPVDGEGGLIEVTGTHASSSREQAGMSVLLLLLSLAGVVGLAKIGSRQIESFVIDAGLPHAALGVLIAAVVLAPEFLASVKAARRGLVQVSLNLALGSAIAAIGLTIPTVALASIWIEGELLLGLGQAQIALFAIAMFTTALTVVSGRANIVNGGLHLGLFVLFLLAALTR